MGRSTKGKRARRKGKAARQAARYVIADIEPQAAASGIRAKRGKRGDVAEGHQFPRGLSQRLKLVVIAIAFVASLAAIQRVYNAQVSVQRASRSCMLLDPSRHINQPAKRPPVALRGLCAVFECDLPALRPALPSVPN